MEGDSDIRCTVKTIRDCIATDCTRLLYSPNNHKIKSKLTEKMSSSAMASARCRVLELRLMVFCMSLMSAVILSMSLFCFTIEQWR